MELAPPDIAGKSSLSLASLVVLWWVLALSAIWGAFLLVIILLNVAGFDDQWTRGASVMAWVTVLVFTAALLAWRKATFRRKDFIALAERMGVRVTSKLWYPSMWHMLSVYSYAMGNLGDARVVGRFDMPFFAYNLAPTISWGRTFKSGRTVLEGSYHPRYMLTESKVELFSLVSCQQGFDVDLEISDGKKTVPATGNAAVDMLIERHLWDVKDLRARLVCDKYGLKLTIIGGSWLGKKYGERISHGATLFQEIDAGLRKDCAVRTWDDYGIGWNSDKGEFGINAL